MSPHPKKKHRAAAIAEAYLNDMASTAPPPDKR
jgi:hypothetical protein